MPSTTSSEFGDVLLVPFPFTNQSGGRPAVVVSSSLYHRERDDLVLMPVTSQLRSGKPPSELAVGSWETAGLLRPSAIKPRLLHSGSQLGSEAARLAESDRTALGDWIRLLLGP